MTVKQQWYKSWSLVSLEDLAVSEKGSIRRGPFGGSLKKEIFVDDGYLVYEQQHAIADDFSLGRYLITIVRTFLREENRLGSYPSVRVLINNNSTGWIGYENYCTESH